MATTDVKPLFRASVRSGRLNAIVVAVACLGVLGVASYLTPDPRGFERTNNSAFPRISSNYLGVPCPLCGMTTAFTLMAHARPIDAFMRNPRARSVRAVRARNGRRVDSGHLRAYATLRRRARALELIGMDRRAALAAAWIYKLIVFWR